MNMILTTANLTASGCREIEIVAERCGVSTPESGEDVREWMLNAVAYTAQRHARENTEFSEKSWACMADFVAEKITLETVPSQW